MPFTSTDLLKKTLGTALVEQFATANPDLIADLITQTDSIIVSASGIQPPADPADQDGNEQMQVYAAWIVAYLMIDHLGIREKDEVDRRRANYDRAIRALGTMQGQATGAESAKAQAQFSSTARVGDIL